MNSAQKLGLSDIKVLDGDRGANYPKKDEFSPSGYCLFLDASNVTKIGFWSKVNWYPDKVETTWRQT